MADIWPEICIWDVLDTFYVLFWYIEVIWCIFGKIEKNAFFCLFLAVDRHAKSIFFNFRPDNRIITFAPPSASISPFPVRFARVNSTCLARNLIFYLRVALLVKSISGELATDNPPFGQNFGLRRGGVICRALLNPLEKFSHMCFKGGVICKGGGLSVTNSTDIRHEIYRKYTNLQEKYTICNQNRYNFNNIEKYFWIIIDNLLMKKNIFKNP